MGIFFQCLTDLSACSTIMAGYYSLTFLNKQGSLDKIVHYRMVLDVRHF